MKITAHYKYYLWLSCGLILFFHWDFRKNYLHINSSLIWNFYSVYLQKLISKLNYQEFTGLTKKTKQIKGLTKIDSFEQRFLIIYLTFWSLSATKNFLCGYNFDMLKHYFSKLILKYFWWTTNIFTIFLYLLLILFTSYL